MQRFLSIDWGEKNIGIAYGVLDGKTSSVIPIKDVVTKSWETAIAEILLKATELKITKLILGNPLNEKGQKTLGSIKVKRFKGFLERRLKIPVVLQNEYYSTQEAGGSHSYAAAIILRQYLEKSNGKNKADKN